MPSRPGSSSIVLGPHGIETASCAVPIKRCRKTQALVKKALTSLLRKTIIMSFFERPLVPTALDRGQLRRPDNEDATMLERSMRNGHHTDRRHFIGGSDARIIMGQD